MPIVKPGDPETVSGSPQGHRPGPALINRLHPHGLIASKQGVKLRGVELSQALCLMVNTLVIGRNGQIEHKSVNTRKVKIDKPAEHWTFGGFFEKYIVAKQIGMHRAFGQA